jgi:hypothetical protein
MESPERRRELRARISLPTFIIRAGQLEPATMIDASYRGLFLAMDHPPDIQVLMKLSIELPIREAPLVVHAVVVRVVDDLLGHRGVGLRFFALNGADRADWESFISAAIRQIKVREPKAA